MLEERFKDSPGKSLASLESIKYSIRDVRARKDPADFVSNIVLHTKSAGINDTKYARILLAYEHIDGALRRDLPRPIKQSTVSELLKELRHQKNIWFDIYLPSQLQSSESSSSQLSRDRNNKRKGQYGSFQSSNNRFQQGGSGRSGYNNYGSNNPFFRPFSSFQSSQNPYQNSSNKLF